MAGNQVTLEIAGDATSLSRAAARAEQSMGEVEAAVQDTNDAMDAAGTESQGLNSRLGSLGAGVEGLTGAMDDAAAGIQAFVDVQNYAAERAQRLARALNDVKAAQQDIEDASLDGAEAMSSYNRALSDAETAQLDIADAQAEYNKVVKEHGANSMEAKRALADLHAVQLDLKESQDDANRALADGKRAAIDAEAAQLDLNEAQKEANPSALQEVADVLGVVTPLMTALISVVALATAAQWLWNIAMTANPIGLIVVAVAAVIAGIVLLATQVDWFGDFWVGVWDFIVAAFKLWWAVFSTLWTTVFDWFIGLFKAWWDLFSGFWTGVWDLGVKVVDWFKSVPGLLKSAFSGLFAILTAPFRTAFNFISDAWNNTVGKLSWTVPSWVPGVGGNSISAPKLPKFHTGGVVPGPPGSEMLALLQAGETVTPAGSAGRTVIELRSDGTELGDALVGVLSGAIRRGGGVDVVFGGRGG